MNNHTHSLIWLDHRVAKILKFDKESNSLELVHSTHPHSHLHHKANSVDSGHVSVDHLFLDAVASAIPHHGPVLIVGPGTAKKELHSHLLGRHRDIANRISAVQSLDHPSDGELLAFGRHFFDADDRMHASQAP